MTRDEFYAYLDAFDDWAKAAAVVRPAIEYAPEGTQIGPYTKNGPILGWTHPIGTGKQSGMSETGSWTLVLDATFPPTVRNAPQRARQVRSDIYDLLVRFDALPVGSAEDPRQTDRER